MCSDVIPYTSYPNTLFNLTDKEDYEEFSMMVKGAIENCTDPETLMKGACHIAFPRCLMGFSLYMCRQTCMGTERAVGETRTPRRVGSSGRSLTLLCFFFCRRG
jgi:hypothetical protein